MRFPALSLLIALVAMPTGADTSSMRCGSKIITTDATKLEVLDKCGEPDLREVVAFGDNIKTEVWSYRGSSTRLTRILTFRGTRLTNIESERTR